MTVQHTAWNKNGDDRNASIVLAMNYYAEAYKQFRNTRHLVGMYLSKLRETECLSASTSKENSHLKAKAQKKVKNLTEKLQSYAQTSGVDYCCFILREQGEDISLMSEIVNGQQFSPLFPT